MTYGEPELVSRANSRRGGGGVRVPELVCMLGSAKVAMEEGPVLTAVASPR